MNIGNTIRRLRRSRAGKVLPTLACVLVLTLLLLTLASAPLSGAYTAELPTAAESAAPARAAPHQAERVALLATGGPDAFGYTYIDSDEPGGPTFDFIDISGSGTALGLGDDSATSRAIGFTFNFYGQNYTNVNVSMNGYLVFDAHPAGAATYTNDCPIPDASTPDNAIYAFWDDLKRGAPAGDVYVLTLGLAPNRRFIVQWDDVEFGSPANANKITFQAILFEGINDILVQYLDVENDPPRTSGGGATFGLESGTGFPGGQTALMYRGCNVGGNVHDDLAVLYRYPRAELRVQKTDDPDPVFAGEEVFYEITVFNDGDVSATDVVVTDTLPIAATYIADTDTCTHTPGPPEVLVCSLDDIAPGGSRSFQIKARVAANAVVNEADGTIVITNTAEVSGFGTDTETADNTVTEGTFVEDSADLKITKVGKPDDEVEAGQNLTYTIFVDNLGPSDARNVVVTDTILSSGSYTPVGTPSWSKTDPVGSGFCSVVGNIITCDLGNLAADGRATIEIIVTANETQDINNLVSVTADTPDPDHSNNQAIVMTAVTDVADLLLTKSVVTPGPWFAGTNVEFQLEVTNNGPSTAENVVVEDFLPRGVTVDSVIPPGGASCTTGTPGDPFAPLTCNLGTLAVGAPTTVRVTVHIDPDYPIDPGLDFGYLENDAVVSSDIFDPDIGNNRAHVILNVEAEADLTLNKFTLPPFPWLAGETRAYRYAITNNGPSVSRDVRLVDRLPAQVEFVSAYTILEGSPGGVPLPCDVDANNVVVCPLGDIPPTNPPPVEVFVHVRIKSEVLGGTPITNNAQLLTDTADPGGASDFETETVETQADLEIRKTSEPVKVYAGEQKKYTIWVHNIGPSDARNVTVTDTLPPEVSYEIDTDNCVEGPPGILTCTNGTLGPSETWEFDIWVRVNPDTLPGEIINEACVSGETTLPDPNPDNDCATARNLVESSKADLKIRKFGKPDGEVRAGEYLTYTVIVDNLGPGFGNDVAIKDILQSSGVFDLVEITSDRPMSCSSIPPGAPGPIDDINQRLEIDCTLNDPLEVLLADGPPNSGRWIVTIVVTADETQDINNVAHVVSADFDPDPSNNQAFVEHDITDVSDLEITKEANPDPVIAGEPLYFDLYIWNYGPSTAENVVVHDFLPFGVTVISASPDQGSCTTGKPGEPFAQVRCNLGTILPNEGTHISLDVMVDPDYPIDHLTWVGSLENDARVYSDNFDDDNSNNRAHTITDVETNSELEIGKEDSDDPVLAGEVLEYYLYVINWGPSTVRELWLYDWFDAQYLTFLSARTNKESARCLLSETFDTVECIFGDLAPGEGIELYLRFWVDPATPDGTDIYNEAEWFAWSNIWFPGDPPDFDEWTTILTQADLEIEKTSWPDKVYAGEQKKYTIWVHNIGPSDALTVTVTDILPPEVTYEIDTDNCVEGPPGTLTCTDGTLKPCETWQFDIWARVDPATPPGTVITNTAEVTGTTTLGDPNEDNNTATTKNLVLQKADLKITKFGKPDGQVRAGEWLTYTIVVDNLGPSYAGIDGRDPVTGNVAIKDILQSDLEFDLLSITSDRGMVCSSVPTDGDPTDGIVGVNQRLQIDCTLLDALEVLSADGPPNPGRWMITATVTATETQDINNVVHVTSDAFDPDPSNNQAEVMHEITDVSDLAISKAEIGEVRRDSCDPPLIELKPNEVTAGLSLTYTLVITNYGPSTAENVVVEDRLPPFIVVTGVTASQGECDTGTPGEPLDKLTCGLGTLALRANATITITADVPSWVPEGTILENDALVYSDIWDPTTENDFAHNLTTVSAWADLEISKSARGDNVTGYDEVLRQFIKEQRDNEVTAGELLQYTLVVTNTGPSDAQNVVITDTLPPPAGPIATVHFVSADGATCRQDPIDRNELTCELGTMAAGEVRTVYILVQVDPAAAGPTNTATITNTAGVYSATADPCLDNNNASNDTTVNAVADVYITKVDVPAEPRLDEPFEPDKAIAGEEHRYLITFGNNGPSVARDVGITDALDFKQLDILGETFVRCEPLNPDDLVTCVFAAPNTVTVTHLQVRNEAIIPAAGTGTLNPGDEFGFYLITEVDPGYVLDATISPPTIVPPNPLIAEDTAFIASTTTDWRGGPCAGPGCLIPANNQDTEQTEIIAEADLAVSKTDTPDPGQNLYYDPVTNKFVYTYTLTIENLGPSDAAKVVLIDTLPVDATFQGFGTLEDTQCYFRDDGIVFCLVGNDENNEGDAERGRLNVGSSKVVEIIIEVDASAAFFLENCVEVKAIAEEDFPFRPGDPIDDPIEPADFQEGRTPTPDPNLDNNVFCETTTVASPAVKVDKKVYIRYSPVRGIDNRGLDPVDACADLATDDILTLPGDELTYCYLITNEGDTWFSSITLGDMSDALIHRAPLGRFEVAFPSQPPLRGTIIRVGLDTDEEQTITIATAEPAKAVLAPKGLLDDYDHILIVRSFTVDFPSGGTEFLGSNTARVVAVPSTKYSTVLPGVPPVSDTDLLHDTLALPVLEKSTIKWSIYEDRSGDGLPSPRDVIEYVVDIPNRGSGLIEATGVEFYDGLYNYIDDDAEDERVPGVLINGSVSAAIHVFGLDPVTGRVIDADLQPPDLAFGEDLLLRTLAPGIDLTYPSAIVLGSEILKGNNDGDDEIHVATRLPIPPRGWLLRFDGVTYDPPIPVTFSLRIRYQVRLKETKYVRLGTIVLNQGWVTYNEMGLFDQRFPDFDPANPDAHTAANKVHNNHAGTPARAWENPEFPGWPEMPVDVEPTNHLGLRFDDYALPGAPIRDDDDPTWFKLERDPLRIQLPAIDHEGGWETHIQVQNGGDEDTGAIVFFWKEYSGQCPYSDPGPVDYACKWVAENGVWSLEDQVIPSAAKSAIVYSVREDLFDEACAAAANVVAEPNPYLDPRPKSLKWRLWEDDDYEGTGEPIAVIAQRQGPNDHDTMVASAYPGISENMEGGGPEYQYFAPYAMRQYHNLDTEIIIQNSGQRCTEVWLEYQKQGDCVFSYEEHIVQLAPGESIRKRVPEFLGAEWLGSIYVTADEPLGIIMDQTSFLPSEDRGGLLTYEARPYKLTTDTLFFADLIWRELSGWQASIQVQNLTQHSQPTFVTVEFFDNSGDSILFLGDWVCRGGGATFYLPAIVSLGVNYPAGYVGAAVIQSHAQVDYPGGVHDGQPIFAVVDLKKTKVWDEDLGKWRHTLPGEVQGGAYNALAEGDKEAASDIMLPFLSKARDDQGVTSLIAMRNNSNCNDIELRLEVRKGTGTVVTYLTDFWLPAGHIKLIDLASIGSVNPGFVGAGTVEVTDVRQLCDTDSDGYKDQTPTMPSVVVVNRGADPGDVTSVYEGIPFDYHGSSCLVTVSGQIIDELTLDPIKGADVNGHLTDSWGYYEFQVPSSMWGTAFSLDVSRDGYYAWSEDYTLYCDDLVVNPVLYPVCDTVGVVGFVEDKMTGLPIAGANVWAANCQDSDSAVTGANGYYSMELDYDDDCVTWVMAGADGYNGSSDSVFIPICDVANITFQLHQTPKKRVLLYYGNGGVGAPRGDPVAFTKLAELFEDRGKIVDYTGEWPDEFDWTLKYELIVLLGPGHDSGEDLGVDGFTIGQKADLDGYLQQNGKLAILSDAAGFTGVGVENDLLTTLPVTLRFDVANYSSGHGDQITVDCLTTNVQVYSALEGADNWTSVQATVLGAAPGDLIKQNAGAGQGPNQEMYAVDVPSHGNGWVAILGDMHGLSDVGWMSYMNWSADNEWIPVNWIGCAP